FFTIVFTFTVSFIIFYIFFSTYFYLFFFFNDTPTTEIYTLSLHDALPICGMGFYYLELRAGKLVRLEEYAIGDADLAYIVQRSEIGRAHVLTPVTVRSRMPSSA